MVEDESAQWFARAESDLKASEYLLNGGFFEESSFYSQQAAEKAIKAVYLKKFGEISKTHELVGLGKKIGLEKQLLNGCEELSSLYLAARYPGLEEQINEEDAKNALETARKVLEWAKARLT